MVPAFLFASVVILLIGPPGYLKYGIIPWGNTQGRGDGSRLV